MMPEKLSTLLQSSLQARVTSLEPKHVAAIRVFNGFLEGFPDLVIEIFASTLVISISDEQSPLIAQSLEIVRLYKHSLPWIDSAIVKRRRSKIPGEHNGEVIFGTNPADRIEENGIWYAVNMVFQQDNSFYLDTRGLRKWLKDHSQNWIALNTFAYTGSLGIAALAGGAQRVIQADLNAKFLALAKESARLNRIPVVSKDYLAEDFFSTASRFRHSPMQFDCVIIDPPFFSQTEMGTIDLQKQFFRVINKIRPLVKDGGCIVSINNSLYTSGQDYINQLEQLSRDGYLDIEELIPVPPDCTGYPGTIVGKPPSDPTPFNHSTKIVIIKVQKKSNH